MWHGLGVHWRFIQIKGGFGRGELRGSVLGNWVRYGRKGDPSKWEGQNVLGRVLMQLRNDLWREGGYRIW